MERALVTGATGFLGGALARRLAASGAAEVIGLGRDRAEGAALERDGVRFVAAALEDRDALVPLLAGVDVVYHCGALSSLWGPSAAFWAANVEGTRHVVEGCLQHGVRRLVHVSTPSLYHDCGDRRMIREDEPLPPMAINAYALTKRAAERVVDEAARRGLEAVTLRPRAIFGPGDRAVLPRIIRALKTGRLRVVGSGQNVVDVTYIDNCVDALVLAAQAEGRIVRGRKYNITNGEPIALWPFIDRLALELGLPRPRGRAPRGLVRALAGVVEDAHRWLRPEREPVLTRYSVDVMTLSTTLDITRARQELGYAPKVGVEEGLARFARWWHTQEGAGR